MQPISLFGLWRQEFAGYNSNKFRQDIFAGIHIALVALPLALAFGLASGVPAALGLVTSILASFIIGALTGAPYQVAGATAILSAILLPVSQHYGIEGVWIVSVISGLFLLFLGYFRLEQFVGFIPTPVLTAFTTGIALNIIVNQIGNLFGLPQTASAVDGSQGLGQLLTGDSTFAHLLNYLQSGLQLDWRALVMGLIVILTTLFLPKAWEKYLPGSLAGLIIATLLTWIAGFDLPQIGTVTRSVVMSERLQFSQIDWKQISELLAPMLALTLLGMIAAQQCRGLASKHSRFPQTATVGLVAQGIGNLLIPFLGGISAAASVTPTQTAIASGIVTRVGIFIQGLLLLIVLLLGAPLLAQIPLAALAGLLMVVAWQMIDLASIRFMIEHRYRNEILIFALTLLTTLLLGLTQAIILGWFIAALFFINRFASLQTDIPRIDTNQLKKRGIAIKTSLKGVRLANLTGPLLAANANQLDELLADLGSDNNTLILALNEVPTIDSAGVKALMNLHEAMLKTGKTLIISGAQPDVMQMFEQAGMDALIGKKQMVATTDQALLEADKQNAKQPYAEAETSWNGSTELVLFRPSQPAKEKGGKKRK